MKLLQNLPLALTIMLLALSGCSKVEEIVSTTPKEYPIDRKLTDAKGQTIEATITARSDTYVYFRKKGESTVHTYRLDDLSKADREYLMKFPANRTDTVPPPTAELVSNEEDSYLKNKYDYIEKLENEISELTEEFMDINTQSGYKRNIKDEIDAKHDKIGELRKEIYDYRLSKEKEK